jgi:hypothetical protein
VAITAEKEITCHRRCLETIVATTVAAAVTTAVATDVDASCGDYSLQCRFCNCCHQSTMEPTNLGVTAVETPTLAAAGCGHRSISDETLAAAASIGDGEQWLAEGGDCIAASLRVAGWIQTSPGSRSSPGNCRP